MPEITIARKGYLLRKLFEFLIPRPEGMPVREALNQLRSQVELTDYEKGFTASGPNRFEVNLRFATTDLHKAGWLLKQKKMWIVTDEGRAAFNKHPDPEKFYREAMKLYAAWRKSKAAEASGAAALNDAGEPEELNREITFEAAEEQAWTEIEQYLRKMPPYEFQELVADLLRAMGYHIAWIADAGKDGGIDIVAYNDPLGTRLPRIKVQVKRYGQKIDVSGLRSFMAVLGENDVGLFVTTSGFTRDAEDEARKQESRKVTLIDLDKFFDLWVAHSAKLDDAARRRFPLQPIYFLAPGN